MSNPNIPQNLSYQDWLPYHIVDLLNGGSAYLFGDHVVAHEETHDLINRQPIETKSLISEQVLQTPQLATHALVHLTQATQEVNQNFWEVLPNPTLEEAMTAIFGGARSALTNQDRKEIIARTKNKHAQIRAEVKAEEKLVIQAQPSTQVETATLPIFKGLKLKNADRCEKDGYLLYVGSRADCVRAASGCQKGSVKQNSKDGTSWKFVLTLKDFNSLLSTHTFNFKNYASQAVQSYRGNQLSFLDQVANY